MDYKTGNVIEITWITKEYALEGNIRCISLQELKEFIATLAEKFEVLYENSDWYELDYNKEILKYVNKELAKELWNRLGEVPMNPDTEEIESEWNGFLAGTFREDIWRWFEETFHVSVAEDLMRL